MATIEENQKALDVLKLTINKKYGAGTFKILTGDEVVALPRFSSGIASLDDALGGGYPEGRMIEAMGENSGGKTSIALHAIASAQKSGRRCAFLDVEMAFDPIYARNLGVNLDELIFIQPGYAEETLDILESLVDSGLVQLIVVDSIAALLPKAEMEGTMEDNSMMLTARLMSKVCRKITPTMNQNKVTVFWINQIRMKPTMYGSPETTPGGEGVKFFSSIRMKVKKKGEVKVGDESVANEVEVKIIKNKTAPPYRVANFQIDFGKGVNQQLDLVRLAMSKKIINKSGSWLTLNGETIGQGEKNAVAYLEENPEAVKQIMAALAQPTVTTQEDE